jgi:hypothetical protein
MHSVKILLNNIALVIYANAPIAVGTVTKLAMRFISLLVELLTMLAYQEEVTTENVPKKQQLLLYFLIKSGNVFR